MKHLLKYTDKLTDYHMFLAQVHKGTAPHMHQHIHTYTHALRVQIVNNYLLNKMVSVSFTVGKLAALLQGDV